LPPTIITAPTSDTARPNAGSKIVATAQRSCSSISAAQTSGLPPIERNWSPPSRKLSAIN